MLDVHAKTSYLVDVCVPKTHLQKKYGYIIVVAAYGGLGFLFSTFRNHSPG
jgi:hypothetical protein